MPHNSPTPASVEELIAQLERHRKIILELLSRWTIFVDDPEEAELWLEAVLASMEQEG